MSGAVEVAKGTSSPAGNVARRVVLLGASNLTKAIGDVLANAERAWGQPLETLAAFGHGRSYGPASRVLGRQLPGILSCGLWGELGSRPNSVHAALVTDIGNDVLYEEPVERIVGWIEQCLDRLAIVGANTVVTRLPLANLASLSPPRFRLMRSILVPGCGLNLAEVTVRAHLLDEQVHRLARERGFVTIEQRATWYGFDPIHIHRRHRAGAWREILGPWSPTLAAAPAARVSLARLLYVRSRMPHERSLFGFTQRRPQPAARMRDGSTLAIY